MSVEIVKHINRDENNRVEYLFKNFDFYDGNDLVADILHKKCGIRIGDKVDEIFYSMIPLYDENNEYKLVWHEDVGNYIYAERQDTIALQNLKKLLEILVKELNSRLLMG